MHFPIRNKFFLALSVFLFTCAFVHPSSVNMSAKAVMSESSQFKTLDESIEYLRKTVPNLKNAADRRYGYAFLGSIQEQIGQYADAQKSYAVAASIDAGDAVGVPKKSSEQLVIDSVRCALSVGDYASADRYLSSAVKNSKDEKIIAYVKLYTQWSSLCKAEEFSDTKNAVSTLNSYLSQKSMKIVYPQILLTLYHITGDGAYSKRLKSDYPDSMECGILRGKASLLPTPFWFFVPRSETVGAQVVPAENEKNHGAVSEKNPEKSDKSKIDKIKTDEKKSTGTKSENGRKQQIGYFRDEDNANNLLEKLKKAGFSGKVQKEKKSSGNTYYLVYVEDDENGSVGKKLRAAGFDCYPLP